MATSYSTRRCRRPTATSISSSRKKSSCSMSPAAESPRPRPIPHDRLKRLRVQPLIAGLPRLLARFGQRLDHFVQRHLIAADHDVDAAGELALDLAGAHRRLAAAPPLPALPFELVAART